MGFDIKKMVELSYVDKKGALKIFDNDEGIVGVAEKLRKYGVVEIYVSYIFVHILQFRY